PCSPATVHSHLSADESNRTVETCHRSLSFLTSCRCDFSATSQLALAPCSVVMTLPSAGRNTYAIATAPTTTRVAITSHVLRDWLVMGHHSRLVCHLFFPLH